jgi:2-oxoglutarate/2-oxoacid ferredoxin oxidoreductase subunit alpha
MTVDSVTIAFVGSGGAGVMTAGQMLLDAAAGVGWYGMMSRSTGPQIRGGEAAAFVRISPRPVPGPADRIDVIIAFDWRNVARFAAELPLGADSVIVTDPEQDPVPDALLQAGPRVIELPIKQLAAGVFGGRVNMVGLGAAAVVAGLPRAGIDGVIDRALGEKGENTVKAAAAAVEAGAEAAAAWGLGLELAVPAPDQIKPRRNISGNEAAGMGVLKAGVKFCAAYPITPATEVLEWLAPNLARTGGMLVQAEDEIASIGMCIGASFGGVPSVTATSGPGLALMTECIGLGVASETPVVIIDVQRGGPSTGIPTKSEQADLNMAVYGLHGDAPHLVTAPTGVADCLLTAQWSAHLAEALQTPCIMLSDQAMGQTRAVTDKPAEAAFVARRVLAEGLESGVAYKRYADTPSGVSPAAIPGMAGGEHTADGLEHAESGLPSAQAADHAKQLDKRLRKLTSFDYGDMWAEIDGAGQGAVAVLTWGNCVGPAGEAVARLRAAGRPVRLIALRLITPVQPEKLAAALAGVSALLVVEQTHGAQFHKFLRAHYDLPGRVVSFSRPGPLPVRPKEIESALNGLFRDSE